MMFARRLLAVALTIAAVLSLSFAVNPANAQGSGTGTCTDSAYANPINSVASALQTADYAKPNTVGAVLISLISLRYQYEDATPPAGCESVRPVFLQYLALQEDSIYATLAAKIDTANKDAYTDIATNLGPARYKTIVAALNAALANVTVSDSATAAAVPMGAAAPAAAPQVCADAAFTAQVKTDTGSLTGGVANAVPVIKLRYKYEDLTAPAGCEAGRTILIQSFAFAEDYGALGIMAQADSANASTYTDFLKNTTGPRGAGLSKTAIAIFPSLAPTPAPTASS
ncbi:MAG: hypothetical protein ACYDBJ_08610 [Aggregatilineales bacterium]